MILYMLLKKPCEWLSCAWIKRGQGVTRWSLLH